MKQPDRFAAFLSYLLLVFGWVYVFFARRNDPLAMYHTKQSIMLVIFAILGPIFWGLVSWIISFLPLVGPLTAAMLAALVVALYISLAISWLMGMVYALQARLKPLPLVGDWADRLPF